MVRRVAHALARVASRAVTAVVASVVAPLVLACSSSSGGDAVPCNEDPWECAPGHTCWPKSHTEFICEVSGPGKAGDPCVDLANAPSCGDGLACLQLTATGGACTAYCDATDPAHGCPTGQTCQMGQLVGGANATFQACTGTALPVTVADAGAAGD